jgi:hypothetical protein
MPYQVTDRLAFGAMLRPKHKSPGIIRRSARVAVTLAKLGVRLAPKWAVPVTGFCLLVPGPLDEIIIVPAIAVYVIVRNFREFMSAGRDAWTEVAR